ncbi:MAG TPA: TetR family transcriptional regulator [Myxococcota bacterium]|nr:TetR family transcriptional regulator [Myxococcota bacterium]
MDTAKRKQRARRPGRPAQGRAAEDVRRELVAAARELFARRGFGDVGIRELARAAGVTPGMISYYFGGKQGLYEAMLASVFDGLIARVGELLAESPRTTAPVEALIRLYVATIASQPWVPALLLREVVTAGPAARARFVERFAQRGLPLLQGLLAKEIESGALRADLDPRLAVLSLAGMSVFPFLTHPVLGKVFDYELDDAFAKQLAEHSTRLFLDGARKREAAP